MAKSIPVPLKANTHQLMGVRWQPDEVARHASNSWSFRPLSTYKIYHERVENTCRLLTEHLGEYLKFERPNGGLAIWASYKKNISAKAVAVNAAKLGLSISDGSNYFFQPDISLPHDFIRIGYCSLEETEMAEAIGIWKRALVQLGRNVR